MLEYTTKDTTPSEFFCALSYRIPNRSDFSTETLPQRSYKLTQVLLLHLLFLFLFIKNGKNWQGAPPYCQHFVPVSHESFATHTIWEERGRGGGGVKKRQK